MKETVEAIDRLISHLGTLLRYVAPGFAALYVTAAVIRETRQFLSLGSSAVVVLGLLFGPIIYGIHTSALVRPLWFGMVWVRKGGSSLPLTLANDLGVITQGPGHKESNTRILVSYYESW
jgi:hypothetical protein